MKSSILKVSDRGKSGEGDHIFLIIIASIFLSFESINILEIFVNKIVFEKSTKKLENERII